MIVISGGQTGADLAGLWAAKLCGIKTGGFAPKNWKTQSGSKPTLGSSFGLVESTGGYKKRTIENVQAADLTLIFASNPSSPGTKLTIQACREHLIPCHLTLLESSQQLDEMVDPLVNLIKKAIQLSSHEEPAINIAGNSSTSSPIAFPATFKLLYKVFQRLSSVQDSTDVDQLEIILRDNYEVSLQDLPIFK